MAEKPQDTFHLSIILFLLLNLLAHQSEKLEIEWQINILMIKEVES